MKRTLLASATVFALALAPAMAIAKDLPAGGMTADDVVSWLQSDGYPATVTTEKDGSKTINSASDGSAFHISMYDCNGGPRCSSLEFFVGFDTHGAFNAEKMNDWNRRNRWTRAYVDSTNDPWLEMDVDLSPGGTYENLDDQFSIWRDEFRSFRKFINW
ncbi:MAG TPA: YbjN domain-containing protein [Acetobacteraceae bacterium]|nr:YbjN domain-containing protein [Acetobacteraceae bacterium]